MFSKLLLPALLFISYGAHAQDALTTPRLFTMSPTNVNLFNGTYVQSSDDLSIGSLKLERSYVSGPSTGTSNNYFGPGWTHNFDIWGQSRLIGGQY